MSDDPAESNLESEACAETLDGLDGLDGVELIELRPAVELVIAVAIAGRRQRPPIAPPDALLAHLKAGKPDTNVIAAVLRIVAGDDDLRQRAAQFAEPAVAGEIGSLWLRRPSGWRDQIRAVATSVASVASSPIEKPSAALVRQRDAATDAARNARLELESLRRRLHDDAERHAEAVAALSGERERTQNARAEISILHRTIASLKTQLAAAGEQVQAAEAKIDAASEERDRALETLERVLAQRAVAAFEPADSNDHSVDIGQLRGSLAALRELADTISGVADRLDKASTGRAPQRTRPTVEHQAMPSASTRRAPRTPRRSPIAIPGGVFADTTEATDYLIRFPNSVTLIDGYNVAKLGWPHLPLALQREALIDALEAMVRRNGAMVIVVFDGADVTLASSGQRLVSVVFSAAGVSADDEIRAIAERLDSMRPAVVVTDDKAIRTDLQRMGINPIRSADLLAVTRT